MMRITARFTPGQRLAMAALGAIGLGLLVVWLVQLRAARQPIAVQFLGYTNVDSFGISQPFTMAHFRITNQANATLTCGVGGVEFQIGGKWVPDTNRLAHQYGWILRPRATLLKAVAVPPTITRLRARFHVTSTPSQNQIKTRLKLERWLNRIGIRWRPKAPPPLVVTCEVAGA